MLISVIVPTCDRPELLAVCLSALPEFVEVIVSDDSRSEATRSMLKDRFPRSRWVQGPRRGPAANRNFGARCAEGEWLVFLDDDCEPTIQFIEAYAEAIRLWQRTRVFEGKTSAQGIRKRVDEEAPINETGGYLWSCNICIDKKTFEAIGRFDERFPGAAMEDVEFRTRLLKAGHEIRFVPGAQVFHPWRSRKGRAFARTYAASVRYFLEKHPERASHFDPKALMLNLLKTGLRKTRREGLRYRGRGLVREIALDTYSAYCVWRNMR